MKDRVLTRNEVNKLGEELYLKGAELPQDSEMVKPPVLGSLLQPATQLQSFPVLRLLSSIPWRDR